MANALAEQEYTVRLRRPHAAQAAFISSLAKRKIIRAGRRGGKTVGVAILAVQQFLARRRILYATPTSEQIDAFWREVKTALVEPIDGGVFYKNETLHTIELPGTEQRIRAKTAWNADTLRGDYADLLILDEWQLCDEDMWETVGAPMLLDNDGDAVFVYTPPSLRSRSVSKARDPRHAARMFQLASEDTTGRWAAFHFRSQDNPHISAQALGEIMRDMSSLAYRQEIEAEDVEDVPGALWTRELVEGSRQKAPESLARVVIGVDPPGGATECGIAVVGLGADGHCYVLADASLRASPDRWAETVLTAYDDYKADKIVAESNYGGDMVRSTLEAAMRARGQRVRFSLVTATRGKAVRAEPVVAIWEQGRAHLVGAFPALEDEMCSWVPGQSTRSPNRLDALVWACTELTAGHVWRAV